MDCSMPRKGCKKETLLKKERFSKRKGFQKEDGNLDCPGKVGVDASAIRVEVAEKEIFITKMKD